MRYELPTKLTGLYPEAISILLAIDESCLFNNKHKLSHPADLFLIAFNDVIECAHRLVIRYHLEVERYRALSDPNTFELDSNIRIDIFNLLFYTANFIEACQSIIKSLFDENSGKLFTKAAREFKDNTREYRSHTSKIINEIKHQHRRIRPFSNTWSNNLIIGYYVEGQIEPNFMGPEPKIHAKFNGAHTGISLNRDIPYHIVNVYYVAACLASVVQGYAKVNKLKSHNFNVKPLPECLKEIANIDLLLLPDEVEMDIASVIERKENNFLLEIPSKRKVGNRYPHVVTVKLTATMGVINKGLVLPYAKL